MYKMTREEQAKLRELRMQTLAAAKRLCSSTAVSDGAETYTWYHHLAGSSFALQKHGRDKSDKGYDIEVRMSPVNGGIEPCLTLIGLYQRGVVFESSMRLRRTDLNAKSVDRILDQIDKGLESELMRACPPVHRLRFFNKKQDFQQLAAVIIPLLDKTGKRVPSVITGK